MNNKEFDTLIQSERERSLPNCPSNLEANVLRRIRLEQDDPEAFSILNWLFCLTRKGALIGMLMLTVFLSTGASLFVSSNYLSSLESRELASSALGFDVLKNIQSLDFDR